MTSGFPQKYFLVQGKPMSFQIPPKFCPKTGHLQKRSISFENIYR